MVPLTPDCDDSDEALAVAIALSLQSLRGTGSEVPRHTLADAAADAAAAPLPPDSDDSDDADDGDDADLAAAITLSLQSP